MILLEKGLTFLTTSEEALNGGKQRAIKEKRIVSDSIAFNTTPLENLLKEEYNEQE